MATDNERRSKASAASGTAVKRKAGSASTGKKRPAGANGAARRPEGAKTRRPDGTAAKRPDGVKAKRPDGAARTATSVKKGGAKSAKKKRMRILVFVLELLFLVIVGVAVWFVLKGSKTEKVNLDEAATTVNDGVQDYYNNATTSDGLSIGDKYTQIALFGVDSREGQLSLNTRTDTIIIASINNETGEVKLCSVFRDTYLNLSNDTYTKCNAAYASGGPSQAVQMLNMNLDLNIKDYVTVGFRGVVDTVDALGGVDIDIHSEEIEHLNNYQTCIAEDLSIGNVTRVSNTGMQTLNGLQACAYCRIRYTAGSDFKRTERQRTVVTQLLEEAKKEDIATLTGIATDIFPNVSTSLDLNEIIQFASNASHYTVVGSEGFPFEEYRTTGTIGNKGSCVIPTDLTTNVSKLHEYLFGTENYQPSAVVQECSEKIHSDTAPYL